MYKYIICALLCTTNIGVGFAQPTFKKLKISDNGRYINYDDNTPFFWLGDTAWELFARLSRQDADLYLTDRAQKGYTVIQAVAWAELDSAMVPNVYGDIPFNNNNPLTPNEKYFQHIDYVVNKAQSLGIYIALLPTWGDKILKKWGNGPEVFTPQNAYKYAQWIAKRYAKKPIIWVVGGDRNPENDRVYNILTAFGNGLKTVCGTSQLVTFHPQGNSASATFFHDQTWLDINMVQSGHGKKDFPNYLFMSANYILKPTKPTLDGEPRYEDLPVKWWVYKHPQGWEYNTISAGDTNFKMGWFTDNDVRKAAYMSMMAGACGHTYGHNSIWQMWQPKYKANIPVVCTWKEALSKPGGMQMGYMKKFFQSFDWQSCIPAQHMINENWTTCEDYNMAMEYINHGLIAAYSSVGKPISIYTQKIPGSKLKISWYDPRKGEFIKTEIIQKNTITELKMPAEGTDWAIIIAPEI
ncbi:MAG: DUF4038 domain-containing protein [Cytophagales bacterium]|nr:DUF4038 domain-containing protein [Cytophagales bacterium]